ncbi:MAG: hypothetical protein GY811_04275 [Myxococcales bacterium]|nr:hypothetical protein [Myxococcales bacterium]
MTKRVGSDAVSVAGVALHQELVTNRPVAQRLSVQTDGCMLPLFDRWKEAKLVVVLREDCHLRGSKSRKGTTTEMCHAELRRGVFELDMGDGLSLRVGGCAPQWFATSPQAGIPPEE